MKTYRMNTGSMTEKILLEDQARQKQERRQAHASRLTGAHTTMPIEDMRMVQKWVQIAKRHDENRQRGGVSWYLLVLLGFNTGLRIGDLCKLRVRDVRDRENVRIIAEKTGKMTDIALQDAPRRAISSALRGLDADDWALGSRQKGRKDGQRKPISRQRCYGIIKQIAHEAGFAEHVGCHTMRKTFAWNYYKTCGDLAELQKVLNHSSQEATLHYLGLDKKKITDTIMRMPTIV